MGHFLFVSDVHLDAQRPDITARFVAFLQAQARQASALYILGDFLEYWVGDDDHMAYLDAVITTLQALTAKGMALYFLHGNRDFLVGEGFCRHLGAQLLAAETVIDLYGRKALLLHGDSLCTDDRAHMAFRAQVLASDWQAAFLAQPLAERHRQAQHIRQHSQQHTRQKGLSMLDVNAAAVAQIMRRFGVDLLIHGHTHRPAIHTVSLGTHTGQRVVLPDWDTHGGFVYASAQAIRLNCLGSDAMHRRCG